MFTTIVVGTDDSAASLQAVRTAGELARTSEAATVHVVNGYRPIGDAELSAIAHDLPEEFRMGLSADRPGLSAVDTAERQLLGLGVEVVTHPIPAPGEEALLEVADEVGADLIVVGERGHGIGHRILHGSVCDRIVHHAHCSVLVVHAA